MFASGRFFTAAQDVRPSQQPIIQIPSKRDLESMRGLPAGENEDQATRLFNISQSISKTITTSSSLATTSSDQLTLSEHWEMLFQQILEGKKDDALDTYRSIHKRDPIKSALLSCHTNEYLEKLILNCAQTKLDSPLEFDIDVTINRTTFETLIRDLAFAMENPGLLFSFGLPTHHAYSDNPSGFCLLNKIAILIKQCQTADALPIVIGTDVNRDDGLNQILCDIPEQHGFIHIDICDSRVYPWNKLTDIKKQMQEGGFDYQKNQFVHIFQRGQQSYHLINLTSFRSEPSELHPAMRYAQELIEKVLSDAETSNRQFQLFLPTGWDSHQDETAACSSWLNQKSYITPKGQRTQRFKDSDFKIFFEGIFDLYNIHSHAISRVYFGLEGGYNTTMYQRLTQQLITTVSEKITQEADHKNQIGLQPW